MGTIIVTPSHSCVLIPVRQQPNYETWLNQVVAAYQTHADGKDRTFSRFLLDLPHVPQDVLSLLRESCVEPERFVLLFYHDFDQSQCVEPGGKWASRR